MSSNSTSNDDLRYNQSNIDTEIFLILFSIISLLASSSLVFILLLRYDKLVKDKWLTHVVLMIAISDSFVSLSFSVGYPPKGPLCTFQGFIVEFFEKASWLWTDILILNIYGIVLYKKCLISIKNSHLIIWTVVILLSLLPFTENVTYGGVGNITGCSFSGNNNFSKWSALSHFLLLVSLLIIIILSFRIAIFVYTLNYDSDNGIAVPLTQLDQRIATEATITMILYPTAMVLCWLPSQIFGLYVNISQDYSNNNRITDNAMHTICPLYGLLLTLIYYIRTKGAKEEWKNLFQSLYKNSDVEITSSPNSFHQNQSKGSNDVDDNIDVEIRTFSQDQSKVNRITEHSST